MTAARRSVSGSKPPRSAASRRLRSAIWPIAGCWSASMAESLAGVDLIGVEFNHDVEMQKSSRRPEFLIERNLSDSRTSLERARGRAAPGRSLALAPGSATPRGLAAPERPVQSTRAGTPGGPRDDSSRGPGSPGPRRAPDACLTQHPAERRPRARTRLRSRRRGTAHAAESENSRHRKAARPARRSLALGPGPG